jgi:hypothetical protein
VQREEGEYKRKRREFAKGERREEGEDKDSGKRIVLQHKKNKVKQPNIKERKKQENKREAKRSNKVGRKERYTAGKG